jgi:hypothetical protein
MRTREAFEHGDTSKRREFDGREGEKVKRERRGVQKREKSIN